MKKIYYATIPVVGTLFVLENKIRQRVRRIKYDRTIINKLRRKEASSTDILILGDSVAKGYGSKNGGFDIYLKKNFEDEGLSVSVKNLGINGLTSAGLLDKLNDSNYTSAIKKADIILLNIGGNDLLGIFKSEGPKGVVLGFNKTKRLFRNNLNLIFEKINKLNQNTVVVTGEMASLLDVKYKYFGFTETLFHSWNSVLHQKEVLYIKSRKLLKEEKYWSDMVHLNDIGYQVYASAIFDNLKSFVEKSRQVKV